MGTYTAAAPAWWTTVILDTAPVMRRTHMAIAARVLQQGVSVGLLRLMSEILEILPRALCSRSRSIASWLGSIVLCCLEAMSAYTHVWSYLHGEVLQLPYPAPQFCRTNKLRPHSELISCERLPITWLARCIVAAAPAANRSKNCGSIFACLNYVTTKSVSPTTVVG
jgi:hypothetical protein